jgi:hypothetical protein
MACDQSTGAMEVATGEHTVAQLLAHITPAGFVTTIGGDCAASGVIDLAAKRHATCTVTHILSLARSRRPPTLSGLGASDRAYTTASGTAGFLVTPSKSGTLTLSTQRQFGCRTAAVARIALALHANPPAVTG